MVCSCCRLPPRLWAVVFLLFSIAVGLLVRLETVKPTTHVYEYYSSGWMRECSKWDAANRRFIVSFFSGGMGLVPIPEDYSPTATLLEEIQVVKEADLAGNASLGFTIDGPRNRVIVAISDVIGNRYSALAAYDWISWKRLFLTQLGGPEDEKSFADDVAVDGEGNAYVTDAKASKLWKVGVDGKLLKVIKNPIFTPKEWHKKFVQLNGIVYHPNGYLLVIHTFSGNLYKIKIGKKEEEEEEEIKLVSVVEGSLKFGDGLDLLSPTKLVVASNPSKLVESNDDWETAKVVGFAKGATHRLVTAATVKDGKVYLNHIFGFGFPKRKHLLIEADFK